MLKLVTMVCLVAAACSAASSKAVFRALVRGRPHLEGRIVGGEPVDISQYPWQVSLQVLEKHDCGASIIRSNWVLTAAHCLWPYSLDWLSVRAGTSTRDSGGDVFGPAVAYYHELYDYNTVDYDIGVLQIDGSFSGSNEQAIALASSEPSAGTPVTVTGWGALSPGEPLPLQLHAVNTSIVARSDCNASYAGAITERMICAGEPEGGKDACLGDNGSPLVWGTTQVGIASWANICALAGYPRVYTNVGLLQSWVSLVTGV